MPLPAKGAVAPMPSRTAGLFASRGAGRAAGAACVRKGGFLALCRRSLSRPARTARVQPRTAGSQPHRPIPAASKSRVYQSRRVAAASTASGATRSRAGPAPPRRRAGGGIARFAASTTSEQRTGCHAWIGFSRVNFSCSRPSGGRRMAATHLVRRRSRRRRARAARSTASTSRAGAQRLRRLRRNCLDQTLLTDRRDEGRSRSRQCEDELHRLGRFWPP